MRLLLLAGTSLLALAASLATVSALPAATTLDTPGLQTFTVPDTGLYAIDAVEAQGGGGFSGRIAGTWARHGCGLHHNESLANRSNRSGGSTVSPVAAKSPGAEHQVQRDLRGGRG